MAIVASPVARPDSGCDSVWPSCNSCGASLGFGELLVEAPRASDLSPKDKSASDGSVACPTPTSRTEDRVPRRALTHMRRGLENQGFRWYDVPTHAFMRRSVHDLRSCAMRKPFPNTAKTLSMPEVAKSTTSKRWCWTASIPAWLLVYPLLRIATPTYIRPPRVVLGIKTPESPPGCLTKASTIDDPSDSYYFSSDTWAGHTPPDLDGRPTPSQIEFKLWLCPVFSRVLYSPSHNRSDSLSYFLDHPLFPLGCKDFQGETVNEAQSFRALRSPGQWLIVESASRSRQITVNMPLFGHQPTGKGGKRVACPPL
ncbi:hypothetical protein EDB83DRAFT_2555003 [Lactarius deliciosus]|nr:hypothetical protein EDB83DRAFT_2555003 [Lactarius deliciosus]